MAGATSGRTDLVGGAYAALASFAFGGVTVLGKLAARSGIAVTSLLAFRFGIAALLLLALLAVRGEPLRAAPGEGLRLAALGMAGYAVESGLFFAALKHGTVSAVTLLFFTYPVWVAVGSLIAGKGMPGWLVGASLAAAVGGAAVVALSSGGLDISGLGIVLALVSAVTFAAYLVGADAVLRRTPLLTGAAWVSGSASVALAIAAGVSVRGDLPNGPHGWWTVAGMGALTALAFVALFGALRRLGAVRTSVVSALEPLAAATLAVAFIGERLRPGTAIGGLCILAGAIAASAARGVPEREPPVP